MDVHDVTLFPPAALAVLNCMPFDPEARGRYELMSGALIWPDEFPGVAIGASRYLVAYRASITLGEERAEFRPVWDQVVQHAPDWPGLRPERRGEKARRRLLAAQRLSQPCLDELERHLLKRPGGPS